MVGEVGVVCAMSNWDGCGLPCVETSLWLGVLQVILGWWGTLGQVFLGCNMSNVNTINKTNKHIEHHVKIFMSKEFYFIILYPKEWWLEALALWAMRDITHMTSTHSNFINGSSPTVPSVTTFFVALLNGRSWLTPTTASELSPTLLTDVHLRILLTLFPLLGTMSWGFRFLAPTIGVTIKTCPMVVYC